MTIDNNQPFFYSDVAEYIVIDHHAEGTKKERECVCVFTVYSLSLSL